MDPGEIVPLMNHCIVGLCEQLGIGLWQGSNFVERKECQDWEAVQRRRSQEILFDVWKLDLFSMDESGNPSFWWL